MQHSYRPPFDRVYTYHAPYVTKKNLPAMYTPQSRHPSRWQNTKRCNREKSQTIKKATDNCVRCGRLQPYFWKGANFLHPKGTKYEDVLFTGDWDISFERGCLDPRDARFDSFAQVHCQDRCAGKPEKKPKCCLSLDMSVLDLPDCTPEEAAEIEKAIAVAAQKATEVDRKATPVSAGAANRAQ